MLAACPTICTLVPGPEAVGHVRLSNAQLPLWASSVTEYWPAPSLSYARVAPFVSLNVDGLRFDEVEYPNSVPSAGEAVLVISIEPHVSMSPSAKSLSTALSDCDVRVFVRNVLKHGADCGKSALRLSPPSKK